MKKVFIFMFFCFGILQAQNDRIVTIDGFSSPQAIAMTNLGVFVSNMGGSGVAKSGNGFISKLDKTGKIIDLQFIGNLNVPRSIATLDNILYVVDMNMIKGFNLSTKKQVFRLPISGTNTLSDIAVKDSNSLLVADRDTGLILLINIKNGSYYTFVAIDSGLGVLQNITLGKDYLYASTFDAKHTKGYLLRIDLDTKKVSIVHEFPEKIGGIALTENGGIVVASYGQNSENIEGKLYKISQDSKLYAIDLDGDLQSPEKFWIDGRSIWIPDSLGNRVQKITPEQ